MERTSRRCGRTAGKLRYADAAADLRRLVTLRELERRVVETEGAIGAEIGPRFRGKMTDWDEVAASLRWTSEFIGAAGHPLAPQLIAMLSDRGGRVRDLRLAVEGAEAELGELEGSLEWLGNNFMLGPPEELRTMPFERLDQWAADHLAAAPSMKEWIEVSALARSCRENGLGEIIDLGRRGALPPADLAGAYEKRAFKAWLDQAYHDDPVLKGFNGDEHARAVALFRRLDERQMEIAQRRLRNLLNVRREQALRPQGPISEELASLRHETAKKKRFKQIRQLFRECPGIIQALKPCLLMSPISVSQYLDPEALGFDLVIFDEASQVRPEDAIGSIMRAKQVIVVGDGKQLPPTDFFREVTDEEEDVPDLESILDECSSAMPQHMLLWHYRSRHESLIAFSNRRFYGGRLFTFPSSGREEGEWGVSFTRVQDGIYDRSGTRTNVVEARKVAELVFDHFSATPERSLGVIAFSEAQQMAIIDQLDTLRRQRPEFERFFAEGDAQEFFVKNLENVQGDERDVMIFSVGYGRDAQGRMHQNFGPLNKAGGERRLNVAITRARMHVKLVASILPEDVEGTTPGAEALREYMAYAMGQGAAARQAVSEEEGDHLLKEVRAWLESRGLVVVERVGRSLARIDLAVADRNRPGNYVLGIIADGPSYARAGNARDRERLRQEVLTGLGWSLHRVWSQEWIRDRDREGERILEALDRARAVAAERALREQGSGPKAVLTATFSGMSGDAGLAEMVTLSAGPEEADPAAVPILSTAKAEGGAAWSTISPPALPTSVMEPLVPMALPVEVPKGVDEERTACTDEEGAVSRPEVPSQEERELRPRYVRTDLVGHRSLVSSYRSDPSRTLMEAMEAVVLIEGPVHISVVKDRIRDLVAASTGKRPGNMEKAMKQATAALERYSKVRVEGEFLWPVDKVDVAPRMCEDFRRSVDHVCDMEMEAMVLSLVPNDRPIDLRELVSGVSALLGYKRPTPAIRSRVEHAVDVLSDKDTVVSEDEIEAQDTKAGQPKNDEVPVAEQACP